MSEGKSLKSIAQADLDPLTGSEEASEVAGSGELLARIKTALGDQVEEVRRSQRLTSSPACLVSAHEHMSANLERLLKAAGQPVPNAKRILEINVEHPIIRVMQDFADEGRIRNWSNLLFEQSILAEGGKLEDPAGFVRRMNEVVLELAGQGS